MEVHYYFKPQTKYPPRIYVLMDGDKWISRNRRSMGLAFASPFLKRRMNSEEIEADKGIIRLHGYQYESWKRLLKLEKIEADVLDKENAGEGTAFYKKLESFKEQYKLN